jgi:hypothetical protein
MRLLLLMFLGSVAACTGAGEGIEPSKLPNEVQEDYAVFARRCSKCHSLSRPLQSGIDSDEFWAHYVARMRAMPGSGISAADEAQILRFLHYYSAEQRRIKAEGDK